MESRNSEFLKVYKGHYSWLWTWTFSAFALTEFSVVKHYFFISCEELFSQEYLKVF